MPGEMAKPRNRHPLASISSGICGRPRWAVGVISASRTNFWRMSDAIELPVSVGCTPVSS